MVEVQQIKSTSEANHTPVIPCASGEGNFEQEPSLLLNRSTGMYRLYIRYVKLQLVAVTVPTIPYDSAPIHVFEGHPFEIVSVVRLRGLSYQTVVWNQSHLLTVRHNRVLGVSRDDLLVATRTFKKRKHPV